MLRIPPTCRHPTSDSTASIFSGDTLNVFWEVGNEQPGVTSSDSWIDRVYLSNDSNLDDDDLLLGDLAHNGLLQQGEVYAASTTVQVPYDLERMFHLEGDVYLLVDVDASDRVEERGFEANNIAASTSQIQVRLLPPPDLELVDVLPADGAVAGHELAVTFTIENNGSTAPVVRQWRNAFYLSSDDQFDVASDYQLGRRDFSVGDFQPNSTPYQHTERFTLPNDIEGEFFVFAMVDVGDAVFEFDKNNNLRRSESKVGIISRPADLVVADTPEQLVAHAGSPVLVSWVGTNEGTGDTIVSQWNHRYYLSADATLDRSDDVLLDTIRFSHAVAGGDRTPLAAGQSYVRDELLNIPFAFVGDYYLFIETDSGNHVFEGTSEANNDSQAIPITVLRDVADLNVSNIVADMTAMSAGKLNVQWTVGNIGDGSTNSTWWEDAIYLSSDSILSGDDIQIGRVTHAGVLPSGASYSVSRQLHVPDELTGRFHVLVATDAGNRVLEPGNESNNTDHAPQQTTVSLNPVPDLEISNVSVVGPLISGQPAEFTWTGTNTGTGPMRGLWNDRVCHATKFLMPDGHLHRSSSYRASGRHHFLHWFGACINSTLRDQAGLRVRCRGRREPTARAEANRTICGTKYRPFPVAVLPPSDLVAGTIVVPPDSIPGMTVSVTYAILNQGPGIAEGNWFDSVYVSLPMTRGTLMTRCRRFRQPAEDGRLGVGESYQGLVVGSLPGVLPGDAYHIIVRSDIRNHISEADETNNLRASLDDFSVDVPELAIGSTVAGTIAYNERLYYRIEVAGTLATHWSSISGRTRPTSSEQRCTYGTKLFHLERRLISDQATFPAVTNERWCRVHKRAPTT
ncbi:MAG: CARDB domain-containing protein [Pirellulaceae bacterium]